MGTRLATFERGNREGVVCSIRNCFRMPRTKNAKKKATKPPPLRMGPVALRVGIGDSACITCGVVQSNKYDSTLMCSDGHATCFACVAARVRPHALCGESCNGFKYLCDGCNTWLCINRTQELALMCGGHALARERLRNQEIMPHNFDSACIYVSAAPSTAPSAASSCSASASASASEEEEEEEEDDEHEYEDTSSSNSSRSTYNCGGGCACDLPPNYDNAGCRAQLPRVYRVDWDTGHEQRAQRLARLRASLLGYRV